MAEQNKIRCRKCRIILLSTEDYTVVNAHSQELGTNSECTATESECIPCSSLTDRNLIYLSEDPFPEFLQDALIKASWEKGKINCPKCNSRLGSFNFVAGIRCSCDKFIVPPVHFQASKVDFILPNEVKPMPVSHPDQPLSQVSLCDLEASCGELALSEIQITDFETLLRTSEENCQAAAVSANPEVNNKDSKAQISPKSRSNPRSDESSVHFSCSPGNPNECSPICEPDPTVRRRTRRARRASDPPNSQCGNACCASATNIHADVGAANPPIQHDSKSFDVTSTRYHLLESEDLLENESDDDSEGIPDSLLCPVCLDLLYSPMLVKPCGHMFCDPCLRRLAKPTPHNTSCPLCRKLIGMCQSCPDISTEAKEKFPERHNRRWVFEKELSIQNLPLPYTRDFRVLGLEGNGRRRWTNYNFHWQGWRTLLWILIVDSLGLALVLLIKYIFGTSSNFENMHQQRHKSAPQGALDLESSYDASANESLFDYAAD